MEDGHIKKDMQRKVIEVLIHVKYYCIFENILIIDKRHKRKLKLIKKWLSNQL